MDQENKAYIDENADITKEPIQYNNDGSATVFLKQPIKADIRKRNSGEVVEETFGEVRIRKMSFGDMKALGSVKSKGDVDDGYRLLSRLCLVPEPVFDKISGEDMENCLEVVQSFLPKSPKTSPQE